jgi:hypothetical protein
MDIAGFDAQVAEYFEQFAVPFTLARSGNELGSHFPRDGVVLIHACWSGYSIQNMFRILQTIQVKGAPFPTVLIADIDGLKPEEMTSLMGSPAQGHAEGVIFRNGLKVAAHTRSHELEPFLATLAEIKW